MMAAGLIDAAVVGGVDSLCLTTLYGFQALQLTSSAPCRPFDVRRDGLSIGEAAAFVLLERAPAQPPPRPCCCSGSANRPTPTTCPARTRRERAHATRCGARCGPAGLAPAEIDYINLHGTGTPNNDSAEGHAITGLFGIGTPCSSTKAAMGHTLGAAGALEAVICALALEHGLLPGGLNTRDPDPRLALHT